jgi:hypothetical protein
MRSFLLTIVFVLLGVGVASAGIPKPVSSVPAIMPWGMVGTAVAMGLSGLYFIIRRNK